MHVKVVCERRHAAAIGFAFLFFFQAEDGIRDYKVTGVQTCALPISCTEGRRDHLPRPSCTERAAKAAPTGAGGAGPYAGATSGPPNSGGLAGFGAARSGEHTSELQSPCNIVCRLLLEKKKKLRSTQQ